MKFVLSILASLLCAGILSAQPIPKDLSPAQLAAIKAFPTSPLEELAADMPQAAPAPAKPDAAKPAKKHGKLWHLLHDKKPADAPAKPAVAPAPAAPVKPTKDCTCKPCTCAPECKCKLPMPK